MNKDRSNIVIVAGDTLMLGSCILSSTYAKPPMPGWYDKYIQFPAVFCSTEPLYSSRYSIAILNYGISWV